MRRHGPLDCQGGDEEWLRWAPEQRRCAGLALRCMMWIGRNGVEEIRSEAQVTSKEDRFIVGKGDSG